MLLRASSAATKSEVNLTSILDRRTESGIENGGLLLAYTEVAHAYCENLISSDEMTLYSQKITEKFSEAGFVEVASTIAIFNGLVRSADAIGIPLDDVVFDSTSDLREELSLDNYTGASRSYTTDSKDI